MIRRTPAALFLNRVESSLSPITAWRQVWAFSETTGALLWTSSPFQNDFIQQSLNVGTIANGVEYIGGYDGYMHAINTTNGVQIWDTPSQSGGLEMPQPYYPMSSAIVADGKSLYGHTKAMSSSLCTEDICLLCLRHEHWSGNMEHLGTNSQLLSYSSRLPTRSQHL